MIWVRIIWLGMLITTSSKLNPVSLFSTLTV